MQVLQQWQSESDFSKVDVVCAEFIRQHQYVDALRYMEKVGQLVATICAKLRAKVRMGYFYLRRAFGCLSSAALVPPTATLAGGQWSVGQTLTTPAYAFSQAGLEPVRQEYIAAVVEPAEVGGAAQSAAIGSSNGNQVGPPACPAGCL